MAEEWRDVPGWEGKYQASSAGRVMGLRRKPHVLAMFPRNCHGRIYLYVKLHDNGEQRSRSVHSIVAITFLGPRPAGKEVDHIDNDPSNNRADNLRYLTHRENLGAQGQQVGGNRMPPGPRGPRGGRGTSTRVVRRYGKTLDELYIIWAAELAAIESAPTIAEERSNV